MDLRTDGSRTPATGGNRHQPGPAKTRDSFQALKARDAQPTCPCCSQPIAVFTELRVDLATNTLFSSGLAVHVQPRTAEVIEVLRASFPGTVEFSTIISRVWYEDLAHARSLGNQISFGRLALAKIGWTIVLEYGIGYRLVRKPNFNSPVAPSPAQGESPCPPNSPAAAAKIPAISAPSTGPTRSRAVHWPSRR
jgi:DNA-binding winged helix-turn-helix (wHTH) protein